MCGERFAGNDECCRVGSKVREEIDYAVQCKEHGITVFVNSERIIGASYVEQVRETQAVLQDVTHP